MGFLILFVQVASIFATIQGGRMIEWSNVAFRSGEPAMLYGWTGFGLIMLGGSLSLGIVCALLDEAGRRRR